MSKVASWLVTGLYTMYVVYNWLVQASGYQLQVISYLFQMWRRHRMPRGKESVKLTSHKVQSMKSLSQVQLLLRALMIAQSESQSVTWKVILETNVIESLLQG